MYVVREVLSINQMEQIVIALQKQKNQLQQEFGGYGSGIAILWLNAELQSIDSKIDHFKRRVALISDQKYAYEKLSGDVTQAINSYEATCPNHAEQRSESIFRVKEWLQLLKANKNSVTDKHLQLARCIVHELNAVEHDHNQSTFSKLFTESRLARAYMEVLRENCIDPYAACYLENIESETVKNIDSKVSLLQSDSLSSFGSTIH